MKPRVPGKEKGGTPREFDGYELVRLLGKGGMGEVFLAKDNLLERHVAIKFISAPAADLEARQRFLIEARAIARLQHPNVVSIYRIGVIEDCPYLVSEFVRGRSLDTLLNELEPAGIERVAAEVAGALASAHRQGIIHRDIKPANVILSDDNTAKLLDFGIAKLVGAGRQTATAAGSVAGRGCNPATGKGEESTRRLAGPCATKPEEQTVRHSPPGSHTPDRETDCERDLLKGVLQPDRLTETGMLLGSPRYMAPEIWMGEPATYRSDVYSFGALIYALCTGHPPHRCKRRTELIKAVLESDAPPLGEVLPDVDPVFGAIVDRCLRRDSGERFADGNDLRSALARIRPPQLAAIPEGNPYRGLLPFEAEHRGLYFGRDSETRMVVERLVSDPFVLVVGDSGVGKSSLCRAGVLPAVTAYLDRNRRWSVATLVPGRYPVSSLSAVLATCLGEKEEIVNRLIVEEPGDVGRHLRSRLGRQAGLILFIDQMEELLTISDPRECDQMVRVVSWLATTTPGLRLLATIRGDFLSRLAGLGIFGEELYRFLYFLRPLSEERIREAIVGPAEAKGVAFETEDLIDHLAEQSRLTQGGLPLLQFTLAELWRARDENDRITHAALESIGGVAGALARHADGVLSQMQPDDRQVAKKILMSLVRHDGTRVRKTDADLEAEKPHVWRVIDKMVRGRLLVASETADGHTYEIAHEALVRGWAAMAQWLSEDAESKRVQEWLQRASTEWHRLNRDRDLLFSTRQLREVAIVNEQDLSSQARSFLHESRRLHRRRRLMKLGLIVGLPLLVFMSYLGLVLKNRLERQAQADDKLSRAGAVLEEAQVLREQTRGLRREAFALFDQPDVAAGEQKWAAYRDCTIRLRKRYEQAGQLLETALLVDASRADVRRRFADVLFGRALLAEELGLTGEVDELLLRLELYDLGREHLRAWHAGARLALQVDPPETSLEFFRYVRGRNGRTEREPVPLPPHRPEDVELPPGSYLVVARAPGRAEVRHPLFLRRGERLQSRLVLPSEEDVPSGFVYVPPGRFLFGSAVEDSQRREFFHTVPLHEVSTDGYLIARYETTFREWISFLEHLPPAARAARLPQVGKGGFQGTLSLEKLADGSWRLTIKPTSLAYRVRYGEPVVYLSRKHHVRQDWRKVPVVGVSVADAEAYCRWLDRSGRVPGARLCREREWERAARGADGRAFPHGEVLHPEDANYDEAYGKVSAAMGPDEVGTHPGSVSPFGLHDMAGNVWEWTRSSLGEEGAVARGGSYYFGSNSCRTTDREVTELSFRDVSVGFRVCADLIPSRSTYTPSSHK